jgi:hypothetical protein
MRFFEIATIKPITPQQAKINTLKQQKERIGTQIKNERETQQKQKATQKIQQANQTLAKLRNN